MSLIHRTIDVDVPISTAYNQWTQFEEFPRFMEGVERVDQLDDRTLHWCADIGGVHKEWSAEIVEQIPDACISWCSTVGTRNAGTVRFSPRGAKQCTVELELEYEPEGAAETVGDWLGLVSSRIDRDLRRFKHFIEARRVETGAWRRAI